MGRDSKVAPAAHQPTKAELEEDVSIDATPEALAWAVTRGGAERRSVDLTRSTSAVAKIAVGGTRRGTEMSDHHTAEVTVRFPTPNEMLNDLIKQGYIVPAHQDHYQPIMPSAYKAVPTFTTDGSIPLETDSNDS